MNRKRTLMLLVVLGSVVILAAGSWIAGAAIQSPAEAAARTAAPTPSPILVPVEERVIATNVVTRGSARFGSPHSIIIAPSALKGEVGIITTLPEQDTQLHTGDVLLTASGRPIFILQGEIPIYRDLIPGLFGADVQQLEEGLARLGFDPGAVDGVYDELTSTAVSDWYLAAGWTPFGATAVQQSQIRDLEQELAAAFNLKLVADNAVAAAPLAVEADRAEAAAANKAAAADITNASGAIELEVAEAAAAATQLSGEVAIQAAIDAQKVAEQEAQSATDLVDQIMGDLEAAQRDAGVKVPSDEIVFVPILPVRVAEVAVAVGETAGGPVLTVSDNQLAIDASLPLDEAPLVQQGMVVVIDEPELGIEATGVVERIAESPGTDGVDGFHIYFETRVHETSATLAGSSLRLTIPVESTGGVVTAVPISALSLAADGRSRVQIENNGVLEFVVIEPGLSADGYVEVTPVDGALVPGQLVVIGFEGN